MDSSVLGQLQVAAKLLEIDGDSFVGQRFGDDRPALHSYQLPNCGLWPLSSYAIGSPPSQGGFRGIPIASHRIQP
jgi:hypothetical protein